MKSLTNPLSNSPPENPDQKKKLHENKCFRLLVVYFQVLLVVKGFELSTFSMIMSINDVYSLQSRYNFYQHRKMISPIALKAIEGERMNPYPSTRLPKSC